MPAFRSKVFVCPGCKKMISFSPDQEGTVIACPRCGDKVRLGQQEPLPPDGTPLPPPLPPRGQSKPAGARACLFVAGCGCLTAVAALIGLSVLLVLFCRETPRPLRAACKPLISRGVVPGVEGEPVPFAKTEVEVTVTRMSFERPSIYQAALRRTSKTEAPMYCVALTIANRAKSPVTYRTWRRMDSESDVQRAATLQDGKGDLHGSVSFGPETWPEGTAPSAELQPGESIADVLLFERGEVASTGDFLLTLPGENLGGSGKLRFRISCAAPQQGR